MQILESTALGLRTARMTFRSATNPIEVTLFPMVHVGEPHFYEAVSADACAHDVILVEGVRSPIAVRITRSYRWFVGSPRVDLVVQPKLHISACRAEIVLADLTHEEFLPAWRRIPLWLRLALYVGAPLVGLHQRWFATRESLANGLSLDDAASRDEWLNWSPETGAINGAILEARDARLVQRLEEQLDRSGDEVRRVAVIYGAHHMRAVIRALTRRHGYAPSESEWRTIFHL